MSSAQGVCLDASKLILQDARELLALQHEREDCHAKQPLWILMDRIQDPMNFGAVLRSSYYFGVHKVLVTADASCGLTPVVSKASSGALELLEVYSVHTPRDFLLELKEREWSVVGTSALEGSRIEQLPSPDKPAIIIVGNEGQGIHPELMDLCDTLISVSPARSRHLIGSLNVSVATGIVLHQLSKGRA